MIKNSERGIDFSCRLLRREIHSDLMGLLVRCMERRCSSQPLVVGSLSKAKFLLIQIWSGWSGRWQRVSTLFLQSQQTSDEQINTSSEQRSIAIETHIWYLLDVSSTDPEILCANNIVQSDRKRFSFLNHMDLNRIILYHIDIKIQREGKYILFFINYVKYNKYYMMSGFPRRGFVSLMNSY